MPIAYLVKVTKKIIKQILKIKICNMTKKNILNLINNL